VRQDIADRQFYVGTDPDSGQLLFVFAFIIGEDPTYQVIDGAWLNDRPYGTIHRLASSGVATGVFQKCLDFCLTQIDEIRVDTHADNAPMLNAFKRAGLKRCGIICIADGSPRIAFQYAVSHEWQKMVSGEIYDATHPSVVGKLMVTREKLWEFNRLRPTQIHEQEDIIRSLLGSCGNSILINQPFRCDFGCNIYVGERFFANFNFTVLDEAPVTIGDDAFIGPNVSIFTACHSTDVDERNSRREWAKPVTIGDNVWIGGSVTILPGVTIGNGVTIGAGSVVTKDLPDHVVAAGNPARIIKHLK
jgi:maltose O-acetyltransferase